MMLERKHLTLIIVATTIAMAAATMTTAQAASLAPATQETAAETKTAKAEELARIDRIRSTSRRFTRVKRGDLRSAPVKGTNRVWRAISQTWMK